ncbi:MAG: Fic family protein [Desulfuromonadaceae bacterium]
MKTNDLSPSRQKQLVRVPSHSGAFAVVPPAPPRFIPSKGIIKEVIHAHEALGELRVSTARLPNPNLVTRTFDRREAVRSSQIEGTSSDMNQLFTYEATGSDEGLPADVLVTLNYVKALEVGLSMVRDHGPLAVDEALIKELHRNLMKGTDYRGKIGEYREVQNWIGGSKIYQARFVPPTHEHVPNCMKELIEFLHDIPADEDMFEVPIVVRMAIAHAQLETIHPFVDGNGRVGRLLLPIMLAAEGYLPVYIAGYLKNYQQEYYDRLAGVQLREEWLLWIQFFATAVEESVKESINTASALGNLLQRWEERIVELRVRSDSAVNKLPQLLIGRPVITARQVEAELGISFPAANNALAKLEEIGILNNPKEQQRNRVFIAHEAIDILNNR